MAKPQNQTSFSQTKKISFQLQREQKIQQTRLVRPGVIATDFPGGKNLSLSLFRVREKNDICDILH